MKHPKFTGRSFMAGLFCMLITLSSVALAQVSTAGRLTGTVTDSAGAVVPNATVTAKNTQTQQTMTVTTSSEGNWTMPSVSAGLYTVTITAPGFKTTIVQNVNVDAGQPATVNAAMEVGGVGDQVVVTGGAEVLQTQSATINSTITGRQISELPFSTRDAMQLVLVLPGTQTPGTPRSSSINGLPKGSLNITIDGINVQDNLLKSSDGFFTSTQAKADAISEVSLSTATPGAESGGQGSAQVRFVTKNGTNEWHGGGFWQHRNTALNSNYYFNNIDGLPRDRLLLNQAGGNIGGPIMKDKLFFFFNYEEFQLPQTYNGARTLLTPKARQGIYTYRDSAGAIREVNLFEKAAEKNNATGAAALPATVRPYATTVDPVIGGILDAFAAGAAKGGQIRDRISSANDYNRNDFNFQPAGQNVRRFPTLRMDWNVTEKHHLEFVYNFQYYNSNPDAVNGQLPVVPGTGMVLGQEPTGSIRRGVFSGALAVRSTLTPNLVNEVRGTLGQGGTVLFSGEMSPALFAPWRGYAFSFPFTSNPQTRQTQSRRHTPVWTFYDTLTWTKGSHNLSFGGAYTHIKSYQESFGSQLIPTAVLGIASGDPVNTGATSIFTTTNFPGSTPAQRTEAAALYAQLTGRMTQVTRSASLSDESQQLAYAPFRDINYQNELGLFAQDSWRVRPSLTLSYGVRWEIDFAPYNSNGVYTTAGYESVFGISGVGNLFKPGTVTSTALPQFQLTSPDTRPYKTRWNNFAPSFGLAWTVPTLDNKLLKKILGEGGQTVLRGGYSIAYVREGFNTFHSMWGLNEGPTLTLTTNATGVNNQFFTGPNNFRGAGSVLFRDATLPSTPLPTNLQFPITAAFGTDFNEWTPNMRMGYVQSWTFGLQRELTKDMAFEVRYVGNHGTKLWRQYELNEVNIFENGFLDEFKIARENLRLARLANPASNNFGPQTAVAGTRAIPIISTALGTTNDPNFAATVQRGLAGSLASTIAFNTTFMGRLMTANLIPFVTLPTSPNPTRVSNFFVANPLANNAGSYLVTNDGATTYNALQVELRRRLSKGLLLDGSYTFAKSLTNMFASSSSVFSQPRSLRDPGYDKGLSPWDLRHAFKINGIYELPFGKGRRFLAATPVLNKVLEGWQLGGVARIQSGTSTLLTSGRATLNQNDSGFLLRNITRRELQKMVNIRKETVCNPATGRCQGVVYWLPQSIIDNTLAAFELGGKTLTDLKPNEPYLGPADVPGQFGERLFLQGPWQTRIDFNVLKRTKITETVNIEFRAQFLNAFNYQNFFLVPLADASAQGVGAQFGQTRSAFRDITVSGTNDPGGRLVEFQFRVTF
jgi:hypothetical protein